LVISCVETDFSDILLKEMKDKIGLAGRLVRKVGTYWMTVRKQDDGNWKGRL
jgi:hypothetical protein